MPSMRQRFALLLLPLAAAIAWCAVAGYEGLNGQDAHDYLRLAREWTAAFSGEAIPRMQEHPHGYPLLGALVGATGIGELLALRSVSAVALVLAMFAVARLLRVGSSGDERHESPLLAFIFFGMSLSPFLLRQSLTVMSDMAAIASCVLAFAQSVRWMEDRKKLRLFWMLAALVFGLLFRLAVAPIAVVMVGWMLLEKIDQRRRLAFLKRASFLLVAVLFMPSIALMLGFPVEDWSVLNLFRRAHFSDDGYLKYGMPNLVYVLLTPVHPGFIPFGIAVLPFVRRSDWKEAPVQLATLVFLAYALFVGGMPYQNDRVLLLAQPFALMVLWPAFVRAWAWLLSRMRFPVALWAIVLAAQAALCLRAIAPFIRQARVERDVIGRVALLRPTQVYTHGLGAACGTYLPGVKVTELWQGDVERFTPEAVIVARPQDMHAQWMGLAPQRNWQKALEKGAREAGEHEGWVLLKVQ
ncbi:MAG TPA: hypothetical protein PKY96_06785 [Flavobacteriales bacterium]|nr:hypothetical protein [Flavobacteriales bacterium]